MELRAKTRQTDPSVPDTAPSTEETQQTGERVQQISRLLAASRVTVDRALSNSPDHFLKQVRQQGGQ